MESENNKGFIVFIILIIMLVGVGGMFMLKNKNEDKNDNRTIPADNPDINVNLNNEFNMDIIKIVNSKETGNYLISPYSIEIALNMLKEGSDGETYNQINKVVPARDIAYFDVKNRMSVANAIFVKNSEKENISENYINKLQTSYKSDLIYDEFKTPDKINNWVNEKTYNMIPKILNDISKDFVLGLSNAVAIDVEWANPFECGKTRSKEFTTPNGVKNVEMMSNNYNRATYILNDNEKGIILPYKSYTNAGEVDYDNKSDSTKLEFVAVMPTEKDIKTYINSLTSNKLNDVLNNTKELKSNQELRLKLPRFEYDFNDGHFMDDLKELGIKDVFDPSLANLGKMKSEKSKDQLYVSTAIHMTHISLNEKGTKAAAVTYFGIEKATAFMGEKEYIDIEFNKPFMYMIRDTKSHEILFFGVVESPNEWKGNTCSE